jgi:hypothetical protein
MNDRKQYVKSDTKLGPVLRLPLSKRPNRVGVSLPSPGDGNRSSFRNVVFSSI